ncbi:MAG: hypothetical protein JSU98_10665 [Gemmatimonadales bacterium]|jgi:hypothetical protein|nr:MAG: hypothetical protein JSU98_10665 [Gemmatimonadales bacterium]
MPRKSLATLALLAFAAVPGTAQEVEHQWSDARPDARGPSALLGSRILEAGQLDVQYRFHRMTYGDVTLMGETLEFLDVLDFYAVAPFGRTEVAHMVSASFGVTDWLTVQGSAGWLDRDREIGDLDVFARTNSAGLSDLEAAALVSVFDRNGIKAHLIGGVEIPTGSIEKVGPDLSGTNRLLPYEMQLGTGSFSVVPGAAASIQNEKATVGGLVKARFRIADNDRDYRYGNQFDGAMWAQYMLTENFAVTTGARVQSWGSIQGEDNGMDPSLDPGQDPYFSSGTRVDVPLGLNIRMTEGLLSGMELAFEFVFPVHEDYEAPRPGGNWGFNFSVAKDLVDLVR